MAQGSKHSLGEQEIFVPGGEGWREQEREGVRERENEIEREREKHYMVLHTIHNAL